jgi:hypothetical protein
MITNLAPAQYAVYVGMQLSGPCSQSDAICSAVSIIQVVNAGGQPDPVPGTVAYAAGDPTVAAGSVSVTKNGTYTVKQCGYTGTACTLNVVPFAGGDLKGTTVNGPAPTASNWGPITIQNLKTGQYLVYGIVTMTKGFAKVPVLSPGSVMNVP